MKLFERYLFFSCLLILSLSWSWAAGADSTPIMVGGRCTYDYYNGTCTICSIEQTNESIQQADVIGGPGYAGYEVKFEFTPTDPLPAEVSEMVNRSISGCDNLLLLCNSWYPGPMFLEKYNITVGSVFQGTLQVIKSGTCTPVIIEMKDIDRCDYFESQTNRTMETTSKNI